MSRNSPETGVRVLNTIRELKLGISRTAFTGGEPVVEYLEAFDVDLFLTTSTEDAQRVRDNNVCPVALLYKPPAIIDSVVDDQVRIAFDGDAVLFSEESELYYREHGIEEFHANEQSKADEPLKEGPFAAFLKKLAKMQERLPMKIEYSPVRIGLITARNSPSDVRVVKTLRNWGVYVDAAFFLGGVEKHKVVAAFRPHIFFDDQEIHLQRTASLVPAGRVPYDSESKLLSN